MIIGNDFTFRIDHSWNIFDAQYESTDNRNGMVLSIPTILISAQINWHWSRRSFTIKLSYILMSNCW